MSRQTFARPGSEPLLQWPPRSSGSRCLSNDAAKAGVEGVEIKTTRKVGGAREQWMCVFVYDTDSESQPVVQRRPMSFTEIYIAKVTLADFRKNARGELGTRTATLDRLGIAKLRQNWIYRANQNA